MVISALAMVVISLFSGNVAATSRLDQTETDGQALIKRGQDPNNCRAQWGDSNESARCRTAVLNSIHDFCLYAPKRSATIGDQEAYVVSYCTKTGYGTRTIPPGTIHGAQWIKTPEYIQVVGLGDFTKINIAPNDEGGELDPYGAQLLGNPHHSHILTRAWSGQFEEVKEWHMFMGAKEFSFRICRNVSKRNKEYCNNRYDEQGSQWVDPGRYENGVFEACDAEAGEPPGTYGNYHWEQGQGPAPKAHPPPKTSNCRKYDSVRVGGRAKLIPT
ncbi:unnamed protein product [Sympodiomycopsis kandeliae]